MNIYLLGFRGAGKSTLLKNIAFPGEKIDLDEALAQEFGEPVLRFIEREGIERFREREFAMLLKLESRSENTLVANGGGIVDWAASRNQLAKSSSARLYLRTSAELLWSRLKDHPERLVVGGISDYNRFLALFEQRSAYFEQLATHVIDNLTMESSQQQIEHWLFTALGFMK